MSEEKLVPKLRFTSYSNEWESHKLGDILTFYSTNSFSREKLNYESGNVKNIHYGDIHTKFPTILSISGNKDVPFINNDIDLSKYKDDQYLQEGDLIIADASEDYSDIGKAIEVKDINDEKVLAGLHTILARDEKNITINGFKGYLFLTEDLKTNIKRIANGISVLGISKNNLSKLTVNIPNKNEQQKIVDFISSIDKKIELLEDKHTYYQDFKKYLMQQIFAQKLRFNTSSSYSNYKLKDIVTKFSTGLNPRKNFKLNEGGENFYVTIKNFQNGILNLDDKCDKIDDNALKLINKRSDLKKDDLIFASIGRVGEVYLIKNNPINWNINESVFSLRPNKQFIEPKFLYYLLNSTKIQNYFESNITGSTFKSIKMKDLKNTPVTIPDSFELQNKIIQFLSSVDSKIVLVDNELNNIQKFKKGLLQQMFV